MKRFTGHGFKGFIYHKIRNWFMGFEYQKELIEAIETFWGTRNSQLKKKSKKDQGNRGAVTGGKQMDGFLQLLTKAVLDCGVPKKCIFLRRRDVHLPGYFRPTKQWDFVIVSPKGSLLVCIELKSQVGSFGNNFNNRTEESIGSAVDFWKAFEKDAYGSSIAPWFGYLMIVEKSVDSTSQVRVTEPHFKVFREFKNTSYLDRYSLLCKKLMLEKKYTATSLIWTTLESNGKIKSGYTDKDLSFETFIDSLKGYLFGRRRELKG